MKKNKYKFIDYDREADVLYISFEKPQRATDSILRDNVLIRKRLQPVHRVLPSSLRLDGPLGKIIGLTILNVSKFTPLRK